METAVIARSSLSDLRPLPEHDPTKRFSSRVENYIRYRPGYPKEVVGLLKSECGLTPQSVIADVGSGTGKLAELFLANGNPVFGVEPNREMRQAGERLLKDFARFTSVAAAAEATTLPAASVDFITAGQAFHWFDRTKCRMEFASILKPGGWVVLVWNDRQTQSSRFLIEYEKLLKDYATDYAKVDHKNIDDDVVREFFGHAPGKKTFPNSQEFDYEGLKGRLLSSSYAPEPDQPNHAEMIRDLEKLYKTHQQSSRVQFIYDTVVYYGKLK